MQNMTIRRPGADRGRTCTPQVHKVPRPSCGRSIVTLCVGATSAGVVRYAVAIAAASLSPSSSVATSRILNFCTLPVTVIGKESTNFT
jgi:hypothetical protein